MTGVGLVLLLATAGATEQAAPLRTSLPWLGGSCRDGRYPQLAGDWAIGCLGNDVNRALHLDSGAQVELQRAVESPGAFDGGLVGANGVWRLPVGTPVGKPAPMVEASAWTSDGTRHAVTTTDGILVYEGNRRKLVEVEAAPWLPPALVDGGVAWVHDDRVYVDRGDGVEDLGVGWHVVASGPTLAWVTHEGVCIDGPKVERCIPSDAYTTRRLSLDGDVACWEHYNGADVDIWCSDGVRIEGEGHQRGPSRSGRRILYREDGQTLLMTLPEPAEE